MKTHEIHKALELRGFPGGLSKNEMVRLVDAVRSCVDKALSDAALLQSTALPVGEADSSVAIHIDQYDKLECCRRMLEIIATGDSEDPRKDAEAELVAHGFWNPKPTEPAPSMAGEREAGFTTGHCKEHAKPGGCQLHNLQCGYPDCDRRAV